MTNTKEGAPPPAYGSQTNSPYQDAGPAAPQQAHFMQNQGGYPPNDSNNPYNKPQGGYFQQGPMQYGSPQNGYYGQPQNGGYYQGQGPGPYGQYPQQGYYGQPGPYGYGQPQGHYMDNRGGSPGFAEALLASLACCCCLDACLLF